tara:strand:+ start:3314 stop:5074 length:1761 start_codon:yes stop_codon:yes gene_type:complete
VEAQNNPGFNTMFVDSADFIQAESDLKAINSNSASTPEQKKAAEKTLKAERLKLLAKMINILAENEYNRSEILALKLYLNNLKQKPSQTIKYPSVFKDASDDTVAKLYRGSLKILTDYKSYEAAKYKIDKLVMKNYNKYYQYYVFNIKVEGQNYLESLAEDFEKEKLRKKNVVFSEFVNMMTNGTSGTYVNYYNVNQLGRNAPIQKYLSQTNWQEKDYKLFFTAVDNKGYKKWKAWALDKKEVYKTIPRIDIADLSEADLKQAIKDAKANANTNLAALQAQLAATQTRAAALQQQIQQAQQARNASSTSSSNASSSSSSSSSNASSTLPLTAQTSALTPSKTVEDYLDLITSWNTNLKQILIDMKADTDITNPELDTSMNKYFKQGTKKWQNYIKAGSDNGKRDQKINILLNFKLLKEVATEVEARSLVTTNTQLQYEEVFEDPDRANGNYQEITANTIKFLLHLRKDSVNVSKLPNNDKLKLLKRLFNYIVNDEGDDGESYQIRFDPVVNERIPVYSDYEEFTDLEYEDYTDEEYGEFVDKLDQEVTQIIEEEGATLNDSEPGSYDMSGSESGSYELSGSESGSY